MEQTQLNPQLTGKIVHLKDERFVRDTITQTNVIHIQSGGQGKFSMIFSKEAVDLMSETLTPNPESAGGMISSLTDSDMQMFRLQIANFAFEPAAALQLHESLTNALIGAGIINGQK